MFYQRLRERAVAVQGITSQRPSSIIGGGNLRWPPEQHYARCWRAISWKPHRLLGLFEAGSLSHIRLGWIKPDCPQRLDPAGRSFVSLSVRLPLRTRITQPRHAALDSTEVTPR